MLHRLIITALATIFCTTYSLQLVAHAEEAIQPDKLLITEIQITGLNQTLGNVEDGKAEFIELYNPHDKQLDVDGWQIQYLTASHNGSAPPTRLLGQLSGTVDPYAYVLFAYDGYFLEYLSETFIENYSSGSLAKNGSVRLVNSAGVSIDTIGWGSANIFEGTSADVSPGGKSLQRCVSDTGDVIDTDDNHTDLSIYHEISPRALLSCPGMPEDEEPMPEEPGIGTNCQGVSVSEIMPNPASSDTGKEFIEIQNMSDEPVEMEGCGLQTSASAKIYIFPKLTLNTGELKAIYSNETGLSLPNASGGKVWLISADNVELAAIDYPSGIEDDASWSLIGDSWQATYAATPNVVNMLLSVKPCPADQVRDEYTNRCKTIITSEGNKLAACKAGQVRNKETNRCRSVLGASTALTACKADEIRNPETNRCKKIVTSSSTLTICKKGYERNAITNRCRKILATKDALKNVTDIKSSEVTRGKSAWVTGGIVFLAIAYGVFEWRDDIRLRLKKIFRIV